MRMSALRERLGGSLFFIPMAFVIGAIVLAQLGIALDSTISDGATKLPLGFTSTVESARAVLSTVAGATITVAGIAFSVALLIVQQASSQYSPRVVTGLFRDRFNKRVMGLVVGTFTYCLVVLRSVRSPLEQQGDPVIPNVSVAFGVLLGIGAMLAIVAFINHNAHSMGISEILDVVTRDAVAACDDHWSANLFEPSPIQDPDVVPSGPGLAVRFDRDGWVQFLDPDALLEVIPEGGTLRLDTAVGHYAIRGAPLCTVWPEPPEPHDVARRARAAVHVGTTRSLRQDATYGVRQLADVALKALSPGVNDPTTAQDVIFHIAAVLRPLLERESPARDLCHDNRRMVLAHADGTEELIVLAYDEIRLAAAELPTVCIYLLESISLLERSLELPRRPEAVMALRAQADLVMEACAHTDLDPHDIARVRDVHTKHFAR